MVINDRYRFIFVHVPKSGGTSMSAVLRKLPGNNVRWLYAGSKHESLEEFRQRFPQRRRWSDALLRRTPLGYRSFGFVRHPWQRISSLYRYLKEARPRPEIVRASTLADFLRQAIDGQAWIRSLHSMRPQVELLGGTEGGMAADFVGHYEHIAGDFARAARWFGFPNVKLPHRNDSSNSRIDYRREFTDAMVEAVADLFCADIRAFGYEFDQLRPKRRGTEWPSSDVISESNAPPTRQAA